ncbi:MAG: sigma-70 family RNA polymerase sigma factor [Oscillospiraceae bacterium]|nr:sigma-70 family RNA polymerase sigma factor [Peptococcaceae bacterium]MBR2132646.1 sigma-70 family RNA polymerase sigma factor [Oscillospiraceae bacterium]MBR2894175.1 sigma-70 family RNA polymerase sigma factor [Oscillospiraceae bacterium]
MTDEQIVTLYWDRNEDAIQQTKQKYEAYLSKIAYNILADFEDSGECVNDTYLKAWNSMPMHRPSVLSTYLGKIARQLSIDVFRKKNSTKRYASEYASSLNELSDSFSDNTTPEQLLDAKLLDEAINRFLRTLPDAERNTFIGRYYFFDSLKTVAAYCGMRESKAKSMLYRTRKNLKIYLVKEGFDL